MIDGDGDGVGEIDSIAIAFVNDARSSGTSSLRSRRDVAKLSRLDSLESA